MINVFNCSTVSNNRGVVPSVALATDCRNLLTRDVLYHTQNHVSISFRQTVILYIMKSRRCLFTDASGLKHLSSGFEC